MCTRCRPTQRPKLARLIEALHRLGGDPAVAEKHASIIFARLIAVVAPARGFDIGGNDEAGFYAHPRTQTTGLERELRDLGGKARKAACGKLGLTAWMAAWAVLPQRTMHLLWRPKVMRTAQGHTIDRSRIAGSFSAPGFTRSRLSRKWSCQPSKPRSSGSRQHPARGGDSARAMKKRTSRSKRSKPPMVRSQGAAADASSARTEDPPVVFTASVGTSTQYLARGYFLRRTVAACAARISFGDKRPF
jgi:hypothetical protein